MPNSLCASGFRLSRSRSHDPRSVPKHRASREISGKYPLTVRADRHDKQLDLENAEGGGHAPQCSDEHPVVSKALLARLSSSPSVLRGTPDTPGVPSPLRPIALPTLEVRRNRSLIALSGELVVAVPRRDDLSELAHPLQVGQNLTLELDYLPDPVWILGHDPEQCVSSARAVHARVNGRRPW